MFKILEREQLTDNIFKMVVEAKRVAKSCLPGQFVIVRMDEEGERIPLTICDYDAEKGTITIVFQIVGAGTMKLAKLQAGDAFLDFVGPLGRPSELCEEDLDSLKQKKILFVAGGVGTAPVYPQVKWLHEKGIDADVIVGAKSKDILIMEKEMEAVAGNLYVTTDDGSYGRSGMVTTTIQDLVNEYKYKIELHAHTSPCSGCSEIPPEKIIEILAAKGYDAVMITNHFYPGAPFMKAEDPVTEYLRDYYAAKEAGEKAGMKVYMGAEYRFSENNNDYLVIGVDEAFLRETVTRLDMGIDAFYREYHRDSLLILQAHPFRNGMTPVDPASLDGVESMNLHPHHNSRVSVTSSYQREHNFPVVTIGSDLHHWGHEGHSATRTKFLPEDEAALVALLRSRDYLFEIGGAVMFPYLSVEK